MPHPELILALSCLVIAVRLALLMGRKAVRRRRHLVCEHVVAEHSIRLINCPPAKTGALISAMLAELGRCMGMQRAYIVLEGDPSPVLWHEEGAITPPDWPQRALCLPLRPGAAQGFVALIGDVSRLPDGASSGALCAAGVRAWVCASLSRPGMAGIIGFDSVRPTRVHDLPGRPLLRMLGDVIGNALERAQLEQERAKLVERMERSRRIQTIGVLAGGIAHNFNNVISSIRGYAEMAAEDAPADTALARYIGEIRRAANSGRDLIEGILAFGNESKGARPIRVTDLLAEAGSLLCAALPSSMELAMTDIGSSVAVFGDSVQLQQVIINLCTNASQAMDGRGCVRVGVELHTLLEPQALSHGELPPGRYVRLSVRDTGTGFEASVGPLLFEPFFTTKRTGTGLGLATVREIVRDHDGALHVESTPGQGSTFDVWLPAELGEDREAQLQPGGVPRSGQCRAASPGCVAAASESSQ